MVREQADIFDLVFVGDGDLPSPRDQVHDLHHSEVVVLDSEGQRVHEAEVVEREAQDLLQRLEVVGFDRLQVSYRHGQAENVLVEGPSEVSIEQMIVQDRLPDHLTHELEIIQVLGIDEGLRIRLKSHIIIGRFKQGIVGVEYLLGQNRKPIINNK